MGYRTQYGGELTITPPLIQVEHDRLLKLLQADNPREKDVFAVVGVPTDEDYVILGKLLEEVGVDPLYAWKIGPDTIVPPDESVSRGYQVPDVLTFLHTWLKANGHQLSGTLVWSGDSNEDTGTIWVDPVHGVEAVEDIHDNPGPSWAKAKDAKGRLFTADLASIELRVLAQYPLTDWQYEVANGDTKLGYMDWVQHRLEAEASSEAAILEQAEGRAD